MAAVCTAHVISASGWLQRVARHIRAAGPVREAQDEVQRCGRMVAGAARASTGRGGEARVGDAAARG